ncbi:cation/H(+) antiporter 15-like [Typha latifolia]|uniref:cation/H(+) antiporter 15-like n=1 Tax=Typha latifolia TaxID=4733 RepID=UPI003C2E661A
MAPVATNTTLQVPLITTMYTPIICYSPAMITTNGIWQGVNPLQFSLPLFILQTAIIVFTTRVLVVLLKPLRQPRVIAEILAGIILGPSVMGRMKKWGESLFPQRSLLTLETVAHLGLIYFLFLVGVEMDVTLIRQTGRKAVAIAAGGVAIPFGIGILLSFAMREDIAKQKNYISFILFVGVAFSVTAFPVLARILAEIKMLNSEIGRVAMSSAVVNDMFAWTMLAVTIAISEGHGGSPLTSIWVLLCATVFVLLCFLAVRPAMWWLMRRIPEGEGVSDFHVCVVLTGVMVAGIATDTIGIHAVFGAFVYGLVIPNGKLGVALIEKMEDFVTGMMLPLFFAISGLRTNVFEIRDPIMAVLLAMVFLLSSVAKILGTIVVALFYSIPCREGLALGFLMNTRGLIEMIVFNIGRDRKIMNAQAFAVMVLTSLVVTLLVTPVVVCIHRPPRRLVGYKRRNLQSTKPDAELRLLACVHTIRNVPSIVALLDFANPTKRTPIFVYALHLIELTGRASNLLVLQNATIAKKLKHRGPTNPTATGAQAESDHIFAAFENYEQHAGGVSVQFLSTISPYTSMHEDVCILVEEKHVALIVLPFHKQQTVDGGMEPINPGIRNFNENILSTAPCSVAVLVDRGLSASVSRLAAMHRVALLFFGGPDDREALALASRMVDHPGISFTIIRFLPAGQAHSGSGSGDSRVITIVTDETQERQLDDACLNEFRVRNVGNDAIAYVEKAAANSGDTVAALREMASVHELFIVGRQQSGAGAALTAGLSEWEECPELGTIGDLLASSDFATMVSVLVVQQFVGVGSGSTEVLPTPAVEIREEKEVQQYLANANQRLTVIAGTHKGPLPSFDGVRSGSTSLAPIGYSSLVLPSKKEMLKRLLSRPKKKPPSALSTLDQLHETLQMLEKKDHLLQKKISMEVAKAKDYTKAKNKKAAVQCLKKKRLYESQIEQLGNFQLRVHDQLIMLESAKATADTIDALKSGASAVKSIHQSLKIDDIEKTIEEANEHSENMRQIQEALATLGAVSEFDKGELEAELEELEGEELEEQLFQSPSTMPATPSPSTNLPERTELATYMDELIELQAEMAM